MRTCIFPGVLAGLDLLRCVSHKILFLFSGEWHLPSFVPQLILKHVHVLNTEKDRESLGYGNDAGWLLLQGQCMLICTIALVYTTICVLSENNDIWTLTLALAYQWKPNVTDYACVWYVQCVCACVWRVSVRICVCLSLSLSLSLSALATESQIYRLCMCVVCAIQERERENYRYLCICTC